MNIHRPTIQQFKGDRVKLTHSAADGDALLTIALQNAPASNQNLVIDLAEASELCRLLLQALYGQETLVGKVITNVRAMTAAELANLYWLDDCPVLELHDGTQLYPAQDEEGNGPGCLWGKATDGQAFSLQPDQGEDYGVPISKSPGA